MSGNPTVQQVLLFDATGRALDRHWSPHAGLLDLTGLPAGLYALAVQAGDRWWYARVLRIKS